MVAAFASFLLAQQLNMASCFFFGGACLILYIYELTDQTKLKSIWMDLIWLKGLRSSCTVMYLLVKSAARPSWLCLSPSAWWTSEYNQVRAISPCYKLLLIGYESSLLIHSASASGGEVTTPPPQHHHHQPTLVFQPYSSVVLVDLQSLQRVEQLLAGGR